MSVPSTLSPDLGQVPVCRQFLGSVFNFSVDRLSFVLKGKVYEGVDHSERSLRVRTW